MEGYHPSEVNEITLEELLLAPYVTEGAWEFVNQWTIRYDGKYLDPILAEEELYVTIAEGLQGILNGHTLLAVQPEKGEKDYDEYITGLLYADEKEAPLLISISAGTHPLREIHAGDVKPTGVRIVSLDGKRCYVTIGYQTEPEPYTRKYVFYTEEPALVESLFSFACTLVEQ